MIGTKPLQRVAVIVEEFTPGCPAQHLLDRLLAGYPHEGELRARIAPQIIAHATNAEAPGEDLHRREEDLRLQLAPTIADAVKNADAAAIIWRGPGHSPKPELLELVLRQLPHGAACFVHGLIANSLAEAVAVERLAMEHSIRIASGTAAATTFRLPPVRVRPGTRLAEGLVVTQGNDELATLDGIHALLPDLVRSRRGLEPILSARFLSGEAVWHAGARGEWSWPLLGAAISRSNTVQGDPVKDGRTQDIVQLGLVQNLARNPRCWLTQHGEGFRSCILALDGVVADLNLALEDRRGNVLSTQLYRPPPPNQHHFSALVYAIETHFRGAPGRSEEPLPDPTAAVGWWETLATATTRPGEEIPSPPFPSPSRR